MKTTLIALIKCTISIILLLIYSDAYPQVTIRNMSLIQPDSNVLLQHWSNEIKVHGTNQKAFIVSKNGAGISSYDDNSFIIKPKTLTPDTLLVYDGKKLLLQKIFTIDTFPELSIQLGNIEGDTAAVHEVIANKVLVARFKGSLINHPIKIISFTTTFLIPPSETPEHMINIQGNLLSKEQEAIIKQLKKNSKILFEDILAVTSDNKKRRLSPFTITIR
jgi:hypothetical protein